MRSLRAILAAAVATGTLVGVSTAVAGPAASRGHDVVYLESSAIAVRENGGSAAVTIIREQHGTEKGNVDFSTNNGSATAGSDYTAVNETLELQPVDYREVYIPIRDETVEVEPVETFKASLTNPQPADSGMILAFPREATISVVDNDGPSRFSFSTATYSNYEHRKSVALTVVRSGDMRLQETVTFNTSNGSAVAGSDYNTKSTSLVFDAGQWWKTVTVSLIDDSVAEDTESFTATLSGATNIDVERKSARVDIFDNDSKSADSRPPVTSFHMPEHGKTYRRSGPMGKELHISPGDNASGVAKVWAALRKKKRDGTCAWYNGNRFRRRGCASKLWFSVPNNMFIIYELDRRLKPSTRGSGTGIKNYRAFARAKDHAGNLETKFVRGRNKNTYEIRPG